MSERAGEIISEEDTFIVEASDVTTTLCYFQRKLMERATKLAEAAGAAAAERTWEAAAERTWAAKRQRRSPDAESA